MKTFEKQININIPVSKEILFKTKTSFMEFVGDCVQEAHPSKRLVRISEITSFPVMGVVGSETRYVLNCIFEKNPYIWEVRKAYRQRNRKLWRKT